MSAPRPPARLIILIALLAIVLAIAQLGVISLGFQKLGLSANSASLLLITSLLGAGINLPLGSVRANNRSELVQRPNIAPSFPSLPFTGRTRIAINVGGGLVPIYFSAYLLSKSSVPVSSVVLAILIVAVISYRFSRPLPGLGIGMPALIAPLTAAILGLILGREHAPIVAYISGTLGVLIGADILRLADIRKLGVPFASIGGAGTFDGIFMTGLIAVLLT